MTTTSEKRIRNICEVFDDLFIVSVTSFADHLTSQSSSLESALAEQLEYIQESNSVIEYRSNKLLLLSFLSAFFLSLYIVFNDDEDLDRLLFGNAEFVFPRYRDYIPIFAEEREVSVDKIINLCEQCSLESFIYYIIRVFTFDTFYADFLAKKVLHERKSLK